MTKEEFLSLMANLPPVQASILSGIHQDLQQTVEDSYEQLWLFYTREDNHNFDIRIVRAIDSFRKYANEHAIRYPATGLSPNEVFLVTNQLKEILSNPDKYDVPIPPDMETC